MILVRIICIILILLSIFLIIKPLEIRNFYKSIFFLDKLDSDDYRVIIYRVSGIVGLICFGLLLIQTLMRR